MAKFENIYSGTGDKGIVIKCGTGATTTLVDFRKNTDYVVGKITHDGTNANYGTSSDSRLKENIVDSSFNGTELIEQIKVRNFDWINGGKKDIGFIAQEIKEIWPKCVQGINDPSDYYGVSYGDLVPLLLKSIQELNERIKVLENV